MISKNRRPFFERRGLLQFCQKKFAKKDVVRLKQVPTLSMWADEVFTERKYLRQTIWCPV